MVDKLVAESISIHNHPQLDSLFDAYLSQVHKTENIYDFLKEHEAILHAVGIQSFVASHENLLKTLTLYGQPQLLDDPIYWYKKTDVSGLYDVFFTKRDEAQLEHPDVLRQVHQIQTSISQIGT